MKTKDLQGDHRATAYIPGQATAATADSWPVFRAPTNCTIKAVRWVPAAAVSGANTNNFALQVINKGAANAGTAGVTSAKTYASGTDSAANTSEELTVSTTASDVQCAAGDVVVLVRTVNASGLASPDGLVEVVYQTR